MIHFVKEFTHTFIGRANPMAAGLTSMYSCRDVRYLQRFDRFEH